MSDSMYVQSSGPGMMSGTNIALAVIGILALVALILAATHHGDDKHDDNSGTGVITKRGVTHRLTVGNTVVQLGKVPADSRIKSINFVTKSLNTTAGAATLDFTIGTAADADKIVAAGGGGTELIMRGGTLQGDFNAVNDLFACTLVGARGIEAAEVELQATFTIGAAALTAAGSYDITIIYEKV